MEEILTMGDIQAGDVVQLSSDCEMRVNKYKLHQIDKLFGMTGNRFTEGLIDFIDSCTEIVNPGIYAENGTYNADNNKMDWGRSYDGDWEIALEAIRIYTHGINYEWKKKCPQCRSKFYHSEDLGKLKVIKMSKEILEACRSGENIVYRDSSFGKIGIKITTCKDTIRSQRNRIAMKYKEGEKEIETSLRSRIASIEGIEVSALNKFVHELDGDKTAELVDILEGVKYGLDTDIEIDCPHCNGWEESKLPMVKDFFLPSKIKKL
jgi:hypothetical protein